MIFLQKLMHRYINFYNKVLFYRQSFFFVAGHFPSNDYQCYDDNAPFRGPGMGRNLCNKRIFQQFNGLLQELTSI